MASSIRVRVAPYRFDGWVEGPYLADVRVDDDQPFFSALVDLLGKIDPNGLEYPHSLRGNRSSEPYVRLQGVPVHTARAEDYRPLTRVWAIREPEGTLSSWGFSDRRDLLIADILRASDAGYNTHDFRDVIVGSEAGRGGDFLHYDWPAFFGGLGLGLATNFVQAALTSIGSRLDLVVRTRKQDAALAAVAKRWEQRGITSPYVLRELIDSRTKWSAVEVGTRLQVRAEAAVTLLSQLGYEPLGETPDTFIRSSRKRAEKRRKKWMKHETDAGIEAW